MGIEYEAPDTSVTGLVYWVESEVDGTQATTQWTPVTGTNRNAAVVPLGTGAFLLQSPDGTAAGGNARGTNAVDLQMNRASANNVAAGNYSSIVGGFSNRVTDSYSLAMGFNNFVSGQYSVAFGDTHTVSGNHAHGSGDSTLVSGAGAFAHGRGGTSATGADSAAFGNNADATGQFSFAQGSNASASAQSGIALGDAASAVDLSAVALGNSKTRDRYGISFAGKKMVAIGDNETSFLNPYRQANDMATGATAKMSTDNGSTQNLDIVDNEALTIKARCIAYVTDAGSSGTLVAGDVFIYEFTQTVIQISGLLTIGTKQVDFSESLVGTAWAGTSFDLIDDTNELWVQFTAPTASDVSDFRVKASLEIVNLFFT